MSDIQESVNSLHVKPTELIEFIKHLQYKNGWSFAVGLDPHLIFRVTIECKNSSGPNPQVGVTINGFRNFGNQQITDEPIHIVHTFPIPPTFVIRDWQRWVFDRIVEIETHEAMEFYRVDGIRPYFPDHEPGGEPYRVKERFVTPFTVEPHLVMNGDCA